MNKPTSAETTAPTGLTMTSTGGDAYIAIMNNGRQYTVRQAEWSVKTDYYLDTFVYHLPDLLRHIANTGNRLSRILEIGTARGVLSIGIALLTGDDVNIVGVDIEESARALVTENATLNGVANKLDVRIGDFFEPILPNERFDLILGELPFIPIEPSMQQKYISQGYSSEIINVSGGADGRDLVDILITQGPHYLDPGGAILLIQPSFISIERTMELFERHGLTGTVLVSREWLLDDTRFTRDNRRYIEELNPTAFSKNVSGQDVFYLTIILGVKNR